jgi:hypothetical protein
MTYGGLIWSGIIPKKVSDTFFALQLPAETADVIVMRASAVRAAFTAAIASYMCLGMGSCSSGLQEACRSQLPELNQQLKAVAHDVAAMTPEGSPSRAIASVGAAASGSDQPEKMNRMIHLSDDQRDSWQDWSEKRLVQVEHYLDDVRMNRELRPLSKPLSDMADQLVRFNGYINQGKVYQAMNVLSQAEDDTETVMRQACGKSAGDGRDERN